MHERWSEGMGTVRIAVVWCHGEWDQQMCIERAVVHCYTIEKQSMMCGVCSTENCVLERNCVECVLVVLTVVVIHF